MTFVHPERPYGSAPEIIDEYELQFDEYMHYMYLPIRIPDDPGRLTINTLPARLLFAYEMVMGARFNERRLGNDWQYIYVTARRGFATPGNPLNRPGWHSDGFGTEDINYVWTDRFPTLFAEQEFDEVEADHVSSIKQFKEQIRPENVKTYGDNLLMRLDSSVIHAAPNIPAPGGERSFFKISFSNSRYNLRGNSHNHRLEYDWEMFDRSSVRNDPAHANTDTKEN